MWHTKLSFVPVRGSTRDSSVDLHAIEAAWGASNLISARGRAERSTHRELPHDPFVNDEAAGVPYPLRFVRPRRRLVL